MDGSGTGKVTVSNNSLAWWHRAMERPGDKAAQRSLALHSFPRENNSDQSYKKNAVG